MHPADPDLRCWHKDSFQVLPSEEWLIGVMQVRGKLESDSQAPGCRVVTLVFDEATWGSFSVHLNLRGYAYANMSAAFA